MRSDFSFKTFRLDFSRMIVVWMLGKFGSVQKIISILYQLQTKIGPKGDRKKAILLLYS